MAKKQYQHICLSVCMCVIIDVDVHEQPMRQRKGRPEL